MKRYLVLSILMACAMSMIAFAACSGNDSETEPEPQPEPNPTEYTLTLTSNEGGNVNSAKYSYLAGESVSITATPDDGYYFSGWSEDGELVSTVAGYTFSMPERNVTLAGSFSETIPEIINYTLTLVADGAGSVTSEKQEYQFGESVSVTATPDNGNEFTGWYEDATVVSDEANYTFNMPERDLSLRAVFRTSSTETPSEGALDMTQTISSQILGGNQSYTVYLPPSYSVDTDRQYPILYLLHGLGQNYRSWQNDGNLKAIADAEMSSGRSDEMIIVSPEAYATFYVNGYYQGMNYEDYFVNEFIPAIESTYRVNSTKGGRSISGLSMGGYGCTYHAFSRPEMYSSCYTMSSAFTVTGSNRPPIAPLVTERTAAELANFPAFVMECGTEDFAAYPMNNDLDAALSQTTLVYTYITRPGRHDWLFWQECLPKALKFASDNFTQQ